MGSKKTIATEMGVYVNNRAVTNLAEFSSNMSALDQGDKTNRSNNRMSSNASASVIRRDESNGFIPAMSEQPYDNNKPQTAREDLLSESRSQLENPVQELSEEKVLIEQNIHSSRNQIGQELNTEEQKLIRNGHKFISFNDSQ
jgi:hypothetical protein